MQGMELLEEASKLQYDIACISAPASIKRGSLEMYFIFLKNYPVFLLQSEAFQMTHKRSKNIPSAKIK